MKKHLLFRIIICTIVLMVCLPGSSFAWGVDVVVNPVAGRYYSEAKVSVAYDGTIYYGRLYSTVSVSGPMQYWEILKSVDNGATFIDYADSSISGTKKYTTIDILAAGNDAATFNLFTTRTYLDTISHIATLELDKYDATASKTVVLSESFIYYSNSFGWQSISMASDYRQKNENSSPYTFSIAAVKSIVGDKDSIIVWTDNVGGTALHRIKLPIPSGYDIYNNNVSIAVGSTSSSASGSGRLGIAWDGSINAPNQYGFLYVMFISPEDGSSDQYSGPYTLGNVTNGYYRKPIIAMSQKTDGTGIAPGDKDIRTIIFYEYIDGSIKAFLTDTILNAAPNFQHQFEVASVSGINTQIHAIYSPYSDEFLIAYYDNVNKKLPFKTKSLTSPGSQEPNNIQLNYRDVLTESTVEVKPRLDINKSDGNVVFVWNDSGKSMIELYVGSVSIDEVSIESVSNFLLYPNPATDRVTIAFTSVSEQVLQLAIYDLSGKVVYSSESQVMQGENLINVNTNNLAEGQYVLIVSSVNTSYPIKLVISK